MHRSPLNFVVFALFLLLTGCSDAFLNENLNPTTLPVGMSNLVFSPNWPSGEYTFKLTSLDNVDYQITSKPAWLNISPVNGHISDSVAVVECSAKTNANYSQVGIYRDFLTVKANGREHKVPLAYVTEGDPKVEVPTSIEFSYSVYDNPSVRIYNAGAGVLIWDVVRIPDWLVIDTFQISQTNVFIMQYENYILPLKLNLNSRFSDVMTGDIVLKTNDKEHPTVSIHASADLGTPQLNIYTTALNFASNETSKTLCFSNSGSGILSWKFEDLPEWLTISPSSGFYDQFTSHNIVFDCDRTKLQPGENSAVVHLKTNDSARPSVNITVTAVAPGSNSHIRSLTGNITDVVYNKNTNTLYYVTSQPNSMIVYDVASRTVAHEIPLSKAPTCFAISEDWTKAAVGHNGSFSSIDLSNFTVASTYQSSYSIHDIAWATSDWFCYTQTGGNFSCLHWINMATGALMEDADKSSLDGSSIVKKVPGQPYLIATRNGTSPSGFFSYDIGSKSKKSYAHMDLTNFWMSEDGQYIFAQNSSIYRTTSSTNSTNTFNTDIPSIGKIFQPASNYYGVKFLFHGNHYLWFLQNDSYSTTSNVVYQLEDNDYTLLKQYASISLYQADEQSASVAMQPYYVFANQDDSEAFVLSKGTSNSTWVIQFIPLE